MIVSLTCCWCLGCQVVIRFGIMPRLFLIHAYLLLTIELFVYFLEISFFLVFFNILFLILSFPCIFFYCDMDPCARAPEHFQKWYGSGQNRGPKGRVGGVLGRGTQPSPYQLEGLGSVVSFPAEIEFGAYYY